MSSNTTSCRAADALADAPALLKVRELAQALRVHDRTVRRWIDERRLEVVRLGVRAIRIPKAAALAFLADEVVGA